MYRLLKNAASTFTISAVVAIVVAGCYNDNKETLYPAPDPGSCVTANLRFSTDIQPILNANCATPGCHNTSSSAGGFVLDTYQGVTAAVSAGRLLGTIRHESGYSAMPKGNNKLADCEISKIAAWIDAGAANN